jgi:Fe-S cluster assembly protein SufD
MTSALDTDIATRSLRQGATLDDRPWMDAIRREAAATAARLPFPNSSRERPWKYLDVSNLDLSPYETIWTAPADVTPHELRSRYNIGATAALLIQEDGHTSLTESTAGVRIADFNALDSALAATVEKHLATGVAPGRSKFTALHYALLRGAVVIEVAANAEPTAPIRIVRDYQAASQLGTPHTLIVTGANSRVNIIEDFRSSDADIVVIPAVEVVPGPGSEVRYTTLHRWGTNTRVFSEQSLHGEKDSAFIGLNLVTGGKVVKGHITSALEGRGSSSELYALELGTGDQHIDFYTVQDHIGADTRSDLLYKSALKDRARSVYYGLTRVGLQAKNADANQENRNLLLSKTAKADSDPVLEILTHDVIRVSHGATAGPVDEEQLYYLQARAIPRPAAEALLVRAFLGQVLDRVPDEALRNELGTVIDEKLEQQG